LFAVKGFVNDVVKSLVKILLKMLLKKLSAKPLKALSTREYIHRSLFAQIRNSIE